MPCGTPQYEEENIEEYVSLPTAIFGKGDFFILRASGNSMIEAGIDDGDHVVVKKQIYAEDGDIVVALVDNQNTLKRFYRDDKNKKALRRILTSVLGEKTKEQTQYYKIVKLRYRLKHGKRLGKSLIRKTKSLRNCIKRQMSG